MFLPAQQMEYVRPPILHPNTRRAEHWVTVYAFAAKLAIRHGPAAACELERNAYSAEFVYLDAATRSAQAAHQTHRLMIILWKKQKWRIVLTRAPPSSHG